MSITLETDRETRLIRTLAQCTEALKITTAERDRLQDVLLRNGFVMCDIPACNCGNWHARYGLKECWEEVKQALADAGHPLSNENSNLVIKALGKLVQERDALMQERDEYQVAADKLAAENKVMWDALCKELVDELVGAVCYDDKSLTRSKS